jgi:hypothetical protein
MIDGPVPDCSNAMVVPSADCTLLMVSPFADGSSESRYLEHFTLALNSFTAV